MNKIKTQSSVTAFHLSEPSAGYYKEHSDIFKEIINLNFYTNLQRLKSENVSISCCTETKPGWIMMLHHGCLEGTD